MDRWIMDRWIGGSLTRWRQRENINKYKTSRGYWGKNRQNECTKGATGVKTGLLWQISVVNGL